MIGVGDTWLVPAADRPVRGRVTLPPATAAVPPSLAAALFAAAAAVTGGTVLVRDPVPDDALTRAARTLFDRAGAYGVRSPDGWTVTSRATNGELGAFTLDLRDAPALAPLAAVVAAVARGRCVLTGVPAAPAGRLAGNLRAVGVDAVATDDTLAVGHGPARAGRWDAVDDPAAAAAGLVLGLVAPGVELRGARALRQAIPGVESLWSRLLVADEYLVPGSARLPHEYL